MSLWTLVARWREPHTAFCLPSRARPSRHLSSHLRLTEPLKPRLLHKCFHNRTPLSWKMSLLAAAFRGSGHVALPLPALAAVTHAGSSDSPPCGAACGVDGTLVHPFKLAPTWLRFTLMVNLGVSLTCVERRQNLKASDVLTLTSH